MAEIRMRTIKETATETGLSYSAIRNFIISGVFRGYVRCGKKYLINLDRFIEFLNGE